MCTSLASSYIVYKNLIISTIVDLYWCGFVCYQVYKNLIISTIVDST